MASNWRCDKTPSQNASDETLPRCVDASWWQLNARPAHCQRLPQVESRLVAAAAAATQWQPQITPKYGATQRIESIADSFQFAVFRFIYHLSFEIEIAFRSGLFLRLLLLLPLPLRLLLLLCFCNCSVSLCSAFCCCLSAFLSLSRSLLCCHWGHRPR